MPTAIVVVLVTNQLYCLKQFCAECQVIPCPWQKHWYVCLLVHHQQSPSNVQSMARHTNCSSQLSSLLKSRPYPCKCAKHWKDKNRWMTAQKCANSWNHDHIHQMCKVLKSWPQPSKCSKSRSHDHDQEMMYVQSLEIIMTTTLLPSNVHSIEVMTNTSASQMCTVWKLLSQSCSATWI